MKKLFVEDLKEKKGESVVMKGWIHKIRKMKGFAFVILRDKSGVVQLVIDEGEMLDAIAHEATVEVVGEIGENKKSANGY